MPSLVTAVEEKNLTGIFNDIFDTFKRDIVIHKEPKKLIADVSVPSYFGYETDRSNKINYTYIPVSGVYPATIRYRDAQEIEPLGITNAAAVSVGEVSIKVKTDAKTFIERGKTERITFDNKTFKISSDFAVARFLSSEFYVYQLEATK
jgi:hypothetical protein